MTVLKIVVLSVLIYLNEGGYVAAQVLDNGLAQNGTDSLFLDWWWVLPLIGIALYLLFKDRGYDQEYDNRDTLSGVKGGRVSQDLDDKE